MTTATKSNRPRYIRSDQIGLNIINSEVDTDVGRVFILWPKQGTIEILYFEKGSRPNAYQSWLSFPRGKRVAMRNAGETTPLYSHDFVDAR